MVHILELVRSRRSVRTFSQKAVPVQVLEDLMTYANGVKNPYGIPVRFALLNAKEHGLTSPVISGGDWYVGAAVEDVPHGAEAFGYAFEAMVLYAQSLGLGTTWIGGTMNRGIFERAMKLQGSEQMYCVSPLGYAAEKMSLRETMMRKGVKASVRSEFGEVFFDGGFGKVLTRERAGKLADPLEAVRLAPSAVNKQPWRVVVTEDGVHFYVKKLKGLPVASMQKIDLGIALCHFDFAAQEMGIAVEFSLDDPKLPVTDAEYIASFILK